MTSLSLTSPDIGRFASFETTRVAIPHLVAQNRTKRLAMAMVQFEGDTAPTPFTGEAQPRVYEMAARFTHREHDEMADLVALFDAAHDASDSRLMLRTNARLAEALNRIEVVVVPEYSEQHVGGMAWDVVFTAFTVAYTIEV